MISIMTNNPNELNLTTLATPKRGRGGATIGGGRRKIDPELKKENQRAVTRRYKQQKRIWQAYTSDELMDKSDNLMERLGFRNKHQLLEWLIERGERSLARKGESLKF